MLERAAAPGGKMREVAVGGAPLDAGPTVLTMRWVFEEIFADAGASLDRRRDAAPGRRSWPATPGARASRLDLFADRRALGRRDRRLRRRRRGAPLPRVLRAGARASTRRWSGPSSAPTAPSLLGPGRRRRPAPAGPARGSIQPVRRRCGGALGEHFHDPRLRQLFGRYATYCGSSPFLAPATLMLVAHVEQEGVWLVEGGMHRLAEALAGAGRAPRRRLPLRRGGWRRSSLSAAGPPACAWPTASGSRPTRSSSTPTSAAVAGGLLRPRRRRRRRRPRRRGARSLSAVTWALAGRGRGLPAAAPQRVLLARLRGRVRRHLPAPDACRATPTVYVCAQDRERPDEPRADRARAPALPRQRAADGDTQPLDARGDRAMRDADLRPAWSAAACDLRCDAGADGGDDAGGLRRGCSRRRGERSTARPRTAGRRRSSGRGRGRRIPGLYLAGGSAHPGPGVPMAALSGRMAAASLLADLASTGRSRRDGYALVVRRRAERRRPPRPDHHRLHRQRLLALLRLARRRGRGDPQHHCALNVALYGAGGHRWAMTERGRGSLQPRPPPRSPSARARSPGTASALAGPHRRGDGPPPVAAPRHGPPPPRRRHRARASTLDGRGRHRWWPIAPLARVEVALERRPCAGPAPATSTPTAATSRWRRASPAGTGAARPLAPEAPPSSTTCERRDGSGSPSPCAADPAGTRRASSTPPPRAALPPHAAGGCRRRTRAMPATAPPSRRPWRTPRSTPARCSHAPPGRARHGRAREPLPRPLPRPLVQLMLPFRMPRAWG